MEQIIYKSEGKGLLITCHAGKPGWTGVQKRKSLGPH